MNRWIYGSLALLAIVLSIMALGGFLRICMFALFSRDYGEPVIIFLIWLLVILMICLEMIAAITYYYRLLVLQVNRTRLLPPPKVKIKKSTRKVLFVIIIIIQALLSFLPITIMIDSISHSDYWLGCQSLIVLGSILFVTIRLLKSFKKMM